MGFPCPFCGAPGRVLDSRPREEERAVWRRWECVCSHRWSTIERLESLRSGPPPTRKARWEAIRSGLGAPQPPDPEPVSPEQAEWEARRAARLRAGS